MRISAVMQAFFGAMFLVGCDQTVGDQESVPGIPVALSSLAELKKAPIGAIYDKIAKMSCGGVNGMIRQQSDKLYPNTSVDDMHLLRSIQTYAIVTRCALNEKTKTDMYTGQLKGMVEALDDPHSVFLGPEEYGVHQENLKGEFSGIGIELEKKLVVVGRFVGARVVAPIPDTPAERAGLKAKDVIYMVGDKKVRGYKNLYEVANDIKGERGTSVRLTVLREGEDKPLVFTIIRDKIELKYVKTELLPNHYVWMKLTQFDGGQKFCNDIVGQYAALEKNALATKQPLKGLILDLRNNLGGSVDLAFCAISAFAPPSLWGRAMLAKEARDGVTPMKESAFVPQNLLKGKPLIVLVNEGSASASELVAKVCQAQGYCTVVGTTTYGKGSMQWVWSIGDGQIGLVITFAQYLVYASSGALVPVQSVGVIPNIRVKERAVDKGKGEVNPDLTLRESDLYGALGTSKMAKDIPPMNTKEANPALYREIVGALSALPLKLELE